MVDEFDEAHEKLVDSDPVEREAEAVDTIPPGEILEKQEKAYMDLAEETKQKTKVELSPQYDQILRGFLRLRDDPRFRLAAFHRIVQKIDPEINFQNLQRWVEKMKRLRDKERSSRIKMLADDAMSQDASIKGIRDSAIKIFYLKVTEFLRNPDMLDKMSFRDAVQLYEKIEKLALATKDMELKERGEQRKDVFTVFSMALMAGNANLKDVEDLQTLTDGQEPTRTFPTT